MDVTTAPSPETAAPAERDAIDGILADAMHELLSVPCVVDVADFAHRLRDILRRSNVELINIIAPGVRRSDSVLVTVHTLALAQRNWALLLLDRQVPEGVPFVAHLQQTHDARVSELLEANNREVERRRAAEARAERMAEGLRAAAGQFHAYAEGHRAKGTPEGDEKAETNRSWAERCEADAKGEDLT